jgi:hypothetical protein
MGQFAVMKDMQAYTRVGFLYAGLKSGLLKVRWLTRRAIR